MKKRFINIKTGEVIERHTRMGAYRYFKRDGKRFNYTITKKQVMDKRDYDVCLILIRLSRLDTDGNA